MVAEGTSQACSYRSQELYFQHIQLIKEVIQRYEDAQGLQYHENAVHPDSELTGQVIATVVCLQWELQEAKDKRQEVNDREVNARVQLAKAERKIAQLKQDLAGAQDTALVAHRNAGKHEKAYHETLILVRRAQAKTATATNQAHWATIQ